MPLAAEPGLQKMKVDGFVKRAIGKARKSSGIMLAFGFTLLEIMVSLAIIGGLLVTVLYSLNYHLGIAEKHEFLTVATMLAKNKMLEIEISPRAGKGAFPDPYSAYNYETGMKNSSFPGLAEMWVTVSKDKEHVKVTELREATNKP